MDQYEPYCLADRLFYDKLGEDQTQASDFSLVRREVPADWIRIETDTWMYYGPADGEPLPPQGWKIHISARLDDAERALDVLWDYCMPRGIAFKYLRGQSSLVMYNAKTASRSSSGKLATIYPRDVAELELVLKELDEALRGVEGPYILSDLRYGQGPLYVRYGGFSERKVLGANGELVLALEDGEGRLVPDVRGATFSVPAWTTLPSFLEPHLAARNAVTTTDLPYQVETVLHFSNGGGVYLARDKRSDERVVLKEARPHAGLDAAGRDAVTRLKHERDILERLAGLEAVPALHDYFTLGDHHFVVQEFIDGNPLQRMLVQRYPLTRATCTEETLAEYTEWAVGMLERVEAAVGSLHGRGVVFGDIHPNNILVTADDRLALIDFEVATLASDEARSALANPAFAPPRDRTGVAADHYSLACLRMGLFAPQTTIMLMMHRQKITQLAGLIRRTFPVPAKMIDEARELILGEEPEDDGGAMRDLPLPGAAPWPDVRDALRRAILSGATPERDDRLFPGDVAQFRPGGGINIATGAAGVLYALSETGPERFPAYEDWLSERALKPASGTSLGFYDGLHGVAYVLERLGRRQEALDVLDITLQEKWEILGPSLNSGLSGLGLNLLHLSESTGEAGLREVADKIVDICAERLGGPEDVPEISGGDNPRAGLLHGSSGPALLFMHAYERTGDAALLDKAADALRQDIRRCIRPQDGSLQVNQGWRYLPYLEEGSVGLGLAVARYLGHRPEDDQFAQDLADLRLIARSGYFVLPGLFNGRAGIIAALAMGLRHGEEGPDPLLPTQIEGLQWHAMPYGGGLAYPGDQLLRLSLDFATGTAGVLFALQAATNAAMNAASDAGRVFLPFISPPGGAQVLAKVPERDETPERDDTRDRRKEV
ncbi:class III lanthionine synthetase LanKC [Spirillospora sp. NPDC048911]|uniref:class III lanthionine synthetase LanKC n=1 Tax=Spirillospora sp. NPDC048911 TaxID=3364527 RepID=UPI0037182537